MICDATPWTVWFLIFYNIDTCCPPHRPTQRSCIRPKWQTVAHGRTVEPLQCVASHHPTAHQSNPRRRPVLVLAPVDTAIVPIPSIESSRRRCVHGVSSLRMCADKWFDREVCPRSCMAVAVCRRVFREAVLWSFLPTWATVHPKSGTDSIYRNHSVRTRAHCNRTALRMSAHAPAHHRLAWPMGLLRILWCCLGTKSDLCMALCPHRHCSNCWPSIVRNCLCSSLSAHSSIRSFVSWNRPNGTAHGRPTLGDPALRPISIASDRTCSSRWDAANRCPLTMDDSWRKMESKSCRNRQQTQYLGEGKVKQLSRCYPMATWVRPSTYISQSYCPRCPCQLWIPGIYASVRSILRNSQKWSTSRGYFLGRMQSKRRRYRVGIGYFSIFRNSFTGTYFFGIGDQSAIHISEITFQFLFLNRQTP